MHVAACRRLFVYKPEKRQKDALADEIKEVVRFRVLLVWLLLLALRIQNNRRINTPHAENARAKRYCGGAKILAGLCDHFNATASRKMCVKCTAYSLGHLKT